MLIEAAKHPRGILSDLRGKFIKAVELYGNTIPASTVIQNKGMLASLLQDHKLILDTINDVAGKISITNFSSIVLTNAKEVSNIVINLQCGDAKCFLDISQPKLDAYIKDNIDRLVWLIQYCELDEFISKFFDIVVIGGFFKSSEWNVYKVKEFFNEFKQTLEVKERENVSLSKPSQDEIMEVVSGAIGNVLKDYTDVTIEGTITLDLTVSLRKEDSKS